MEKAIHKHPAFGKISILERMSLLNLSLMSLFCMSETLKIGEGKLAKRKEVVMVVVVVPLCVVVW